MTPDNLNEWLHAPEALDMGEYLSAAASPTGGYANARTLIAPFEGNESYLTAKRLIMTHRYGLTYKRIPWK